MNNDVASEYPRSLRRKVKDAMGDTRVVLISGPRQAGKTTLAKKLTDAGRRYVTLDDEGVYQAALTDPVNFIRQCGHVTIDEIQRAPELIREIKIAVDADRRAGRFLLTGSANILTIPTTSESLAGRMAISELLPLAQIEIEGREGNPLDDLFEASAAPCPSGFYDVADITDRVLAGGYPEMLARRTPERRRSWADNYMRTVLTRDFGEIMNAHHLRDAAKLLQAAAIQSAQLIVYAHIANDLQLSTPTVQRYVRTLEQMYLIRFLPAWHRTELKRLVRTPKLHFLDSGLLAAVRRITPDRLARDRTLLGPLLESFIFSELLKHASWSDHASDSYHLP
ncbi:MAG: ATP-binding protein, partial [Rhodobacteraceae bacterium]|nr:ATP-binding protein [Paracoccaceae bacterium]